MRIVICTVGKRGDQVISETLCDSDYFIIFDVLEKQIIEKIINNYKSSSGSEVFCAQLLIGKGIDIVVCGNCEDNAKKLFNEAQIKVLEKLDPNLDRISNELRLIPNQS
ncbi:MAG: hypothetical protein KJ571_07055 [Bacteroidetes bacterium]|nr:hypothetical protein [Bacteroidota bacterium]